MRSVSLLMLAGFLLVQLLSIFIGAQFISQKIAIVENPGDIANSLILFAYILVAAAVILVILKYYKGKKLFLAVELLLYFSTLQIFFSLFLHELVSFLTALAAIPLRLRYKRLQAPLLFFSSAVVGALLGSSLDLFSPEFLFGPALVLAVLLALYDFTAVFGTKHMISLAKQLSKREAAFSIGLSYKKERIELGTGDLVIPAMLVVSSQKISLLHAFAALGGSLIGLALIMLLLEKRKGYYPALPPIVFFAIVFLSLLNLLGL